jgi:hypothetical protein
MVGLGGAVAGVGDLEPERRRRVEAGEEEEGPRALVAAAAASAVWGRAVSEEEEGRRQREEGPGSPRRLGDHWHLRGRERCLPFAVAVSAFSSPCRCPFALQFLLSRRRKTAFACELSISPCSILLLFCEDSLCFTH